MIMALCIFLSALCLDCNNVCRLRCDKSWRVCQGQGVHFFWREIWEAIFLTEKRHYKPSADGARRQARGSGVSTSFPSRARGSAPETKQFYAFLKQLLAF